VAQNDKLQVFRNSNKIMENEVKQIEVSKRLLVILVIFAIGAFGAWTSNAVFQYLTFYQGYGPREITVSATGKASVAPDIALITLGVTTEGKKVETIVPENTAKMNAILKAVKDLGIEEKDIQTTNYSLSPQYDYLETGVRIFTGYTLSQQINVKVRDFAKIGNVLEKGTSSGANLIGSLQFSIDDTEKVKELAKKDAIAKAKAQAVLIEKETGLKLGKIKNVYENYYGAPYSYGMGGGDTMKEASTVSAPPQIQAGEQEITVQINLTYAVK
jgi:hypothetical protein